ncbi:MAG: hypothetical protein LBE76_02920 [Nitrososphaerota archaeon]|nr:hypothetical protein [Nitrososphaerota archaeon]
MKAVTVDVLSIVISEALATITSGDIEGWIKHWLSTIKSQIAYTEYMLSCGLRLRWS